MLAMTGLQEGQGPGAGHRAKAFWLGILWVSQAEKCLHGEQAGVVYYGISTGESGGRVPSISYLHHGLQWSNRDRSFQKPNVGSPLLPCKGSIVLIAEKHA